MDNNEAQQASRGGLLQKATGLVSRNSGIVLAIIVLLVVIIVYMHARQAGWFGLGPKEGFREAAEDPETKSLIESINSAKK